MLKPLPILSLSHPILTKNKIIDIYIGIKMEIVLAIIYYSFTKEAKRSKAKVKEGSYRRLSTNRWVS